MASGVRLTDGGEVEDMREEASTNTHVGALKTNTHQEDRIENWDLGTGGMAAESRVSTNALSAYLSVHAKRVDKSIDVVDRHAGTSAEVKSQFAIPQKVHSTSPYHKDCIAPVAEKNMLLDVGSLSVTEDLENIEFLREHFGEPYAVVYNSMQKGAHKADLFRYAKLYVEGGIWLDIKTLMKMPPIDVFKPGTADYVWYTVLTKGDGHDDGNGHDELAEGRIYNGMIATPPRNPIILELMEMIKNNPSPFYYHQFVWDFTKKIEQKSRNKRLEKGIYQVGNTTLVLLEERCSKMNYPKAILGHFSYFEAFHPRPPVLEGCTDAMKDQYNLCCQIHDPTNRLVAYTRDPSYPNGTHWSACK